MGRCWGRRGLGLGMRRSASALPSGAGGVGEGAGPGHVAVALAAPSPPGRLGSGGAARAGALSQGPGWLRGAGVGGVRRRQVQAGAGQGGWLVVTCSPPLQGHLSGFWEAPGRWGRGRAPGLLRVWTLGCWGAWGSGRWGHGAGMP